MRISAIILSFFACAATSAAPSVTVTAQLDSAWILMGKQTSLHLQIVQPAGTLGTWVDDDAPTLVPEVEIISRLTADTVDLGNNRVQIDREWILQSFDSGAYILPEIAYAVGTDTFRTRQLALKVVPVPVDTLTTIHDYAGTIAPERKFWDFLPDWISEYIWWYILGLVAIAGVILYFVLRKKDIKAVFIAPPKPIPPYEAAMQQLEALRVRKLCEHGQEREFYTRLTEILREYLDKRFGINAMEMTTSQIKAAIQANESTRMSAKLMNRTLEMADFVKFAKMRPLPEDNTRAFNSAVQFVEETKPQPEPEEVKPDSPTPEK